VLLALTSAVVAADLLDDPAGGLLDVHEVAVTTAVTLSFVVLSAPSFAEIRHRRELHVQLSARVVAAGQGLLAFSCVLLIFELDVDIAHHVVAQVLAHVALFNLAMLGELLVDLLVEFVKVFLDLFTVKAVWITSRSRHCGSGVHPHVFDNQGLGEWGLVVLARAPVTVPAGADLEVEGAVHAIFLGAVDTSQVCGTTGRTSQFPLPPVSRPPASTAAVAVVSVAVSVAVAVTSVSSVAAALAPVAVATSVSSVAAAPAPVAVAT